MNLITGLIAVIRSEVRRWREVYSMSQLAERYPSAAIAATVVIRNPDRLVLGRKVHIDTGAMLHCGGYQWSNFGGSIRLGDHTYIGPQAVLFGAGEIEVGAYCLISPGVIISSHQHSIGPVGVFTADLPTRFAKVVLEDGVWVGSSAVVLPGVRLGTGAIVGAGAVVTHDVEPYAIVAGVPARRIGQRPKP